jgi:hypothetical protein
MSDMVVEAYKLFQILESSMLSLKTRTRIIESSMSSAHTHRFARYVTYTVLTYLLRV